MEKASEFLKNACFIDHAKPFDCVDHNKLWENLREWEYQTTLPVSSETCKQDKKQHQPSSEPNMEQQTASNWERSTSRLYIVTPFI